MSTVELLELALKLPQEERAVLAHELLRSLDPEPVCTEEEWEQAWSKERSCGLGRSGWTAARQPRVIGARR
jgi:hypothetical protein